ncbi:DUF2189 domain-containing protein [Roseinatronobacter monicus]|uniref:Putative membrane protein n=1 Tax=Roseinatronobacter monicus TaxID=393481 RepID=A0A543KAS7_9RHOB|nr:DUF2189 domain-containing protein [Roseinatronobacter monicus]TQM92181.1 putative membrane protein [Roseinatronobacter monicus]
MSMTEHAQIAPVEIARDLSEKDLRAALAAGWSDFKAYPAFGLFFAAFYVVAGIALYFGLFARGEAAWFIPIAAGFPLFAPFAAVGLYEVSRRREAGEPMKWGGILGAMRGRGDEQLLVMGVVVLIIFGFWIILARGIFAIFMAQSGIGTESLSLLASFPGVMMLLIGSAAGALVAMALFAITVVSLPMLLERDIDFMTAMIASLETVRLNPQIMLKWATVIAATLFVAMVPLFLGLFIALPVLGHATWHIYRRAVATPKA